MAYIRSHRGKFQALVRIKGHPFIAKSFSQRKDAKRWSVESVPESVGVFKSNSHLE